MQSGLCCIPGFSNSSTSARKGKIPQSLLESINQSPISMMSSRDMGAQQQHKKPSILPPLPKSPSHHNTCQNQSSRTSSGPPFITPTAGSAGPVSTVHEHDGHPVAFTLSNSVDSMLADASGNKCISNGGVSGGTVFSPVSALPKGLPPKSPGMGGLQESSKCKSLERDQKVKLIVGTGKYTTLTSDSPRCKSLDRRDAKQSKIEEKLAKEKEKSEKEKEKKSQKSIVGSKAAFFGGLLTRRSPSPCRQKDKEKESADSKVPIIQGKSVRFPFGKGASSSSSNSAPQNETVLHQAQYSQDAHVVASDADLDAAFLDLQGRSSQRNRISKWSLSSSNLASAQEQTKLANPCDSPWSQRRSGGDPISTARLVSGNASISSCPSPTPGEEKKWGKIVKTPFGLRYTFGSPRANDSSSGSYKDK